VRAFEYDVIEVTTSVGGLGANMARRALRATSFLFLMRERNFGLALRLSEISRGCREAKRVN